MFYATYRMTKHPCRAKAQPKVGGVWLGNDDLSIHSSAEEAKVLYADLGQSLAELQEARPDLFAEPEDYEKLEDPGHLADAPTTANTVAAEETEVVGANF